jgi:multidrug efflux pump subunit AcrA (membrane-fusion protein)
VNKWLLVIIVVVIVVALIAATVYVAQNPTARDQALALLGASPPENGWVASGFIEADEVDIAPELGGRIVALPVDKGAEVHVGDLLLGLQDDLLVAQIDLAPG